MSGRSAKHALFDEWDSELMKYLAKIRAKVGERDGPRSLSNTSLVGGKFAVPDAHYHTDIGDPCFLDKYADAIMNGDKLYLQECRTAISAYFIDLDMYSQKSVYDHLVQISQVIQETVKKYYASPIPDWFVCAVCTTPPQSQRIDIQAGDVVEVGATTVTIRRLQAILDRIDPPGDTGASASARTVRVPQEQVHSDVVQIGDVKFSTRHSKFGVHVNYKLLHVTDAQALHMREGIVVELASKFPSLLIYDWNKAVDQGVYLGTNGSGLRMIGSRKAAKCSNCTGKACEECGGSGRIAVNRVYSVDFVLDKTGFVNEEHTKLMKANLHKAVRFCSIRVVTPDPKPRTGWVVPAEYPNAPEILYTAKGAKVKAQRNEPLYEVRDKAILDEVGHVIRRKVNPELYGKLQVEKVSSKCLAEPSDLVVRVKGPGMNHCLNKNKVDNGGKHKHGSVWMRIYLDEKEGCAYVQQRCYSTNPTTENRISCAPCSKWRSQPRRLSDKSRKCIFKHYTPPARPTPSHARGRGR